jgi:hypothetical protein
MKNETIKEAAFESSIDYKPFEDNLNPKQYYEQGFIRGAKYQSEKMYSGEDMIAFLDWSKSTNKEKSEYELRRLFHGKEIDSKKLLTIWLENFKKK